MLNKYPIPYPRSPMTPEDQIIASTKQEAIRNGLQTPFTSTPSTGVPPLTRRTAVVVLDPETGRWIHPDDLKQRKSVEKGRLLGTPSSRNEVPPVSQNIQSTVYNTPEYQQSLNMVNRGQYVPQNLSLITMLMKLFGGGI